MTLRRPRLRDTTSSIELSALLALTLAACGGGRGHVAAAPGNSNDDSGVPPAADGGEAGRAGRSGTGGSAGHSGRGGTSGDAGAVDGGDDAGAPDPLAPKIQFMSPSAASDPNNDTVVTDASLVVTCLVARSDSDQSSPVNTSLIKITLEHADDATMVDAPPVTAMTDDLYQATFNLSARANGKLRFHCSAQDLSTTPHRGSATLDTLLDLGPTIDFVSPKDKGIYPLKTPLAIQIQVTPAALSSDDNGATVAAVTLNVGGVNTPLTESVTTAGLYQASIDFNDKTKFTVPPAAAQLDVAVTDSRMPTAPTRHQTIGVTIDGAGPTIVVNSPAYRTIVGSNVTLQVTASDSSGLQPGSLTGTVNSNLVVLDQWVMTGPGMFTREFSTNFPDHKDVTQLTINITATDTVGNQSTVAHQLLLDNLPPVISLDPPLIRESHVVNGVKICSAPFDPVGTRAASDGQTVLASWHYRALVEDRTNHSPGGTDYLAGVDPSSVAIYAQSDNSVPLLKDTNNDGICDAINDAPTVGQAPTKLMLSAVNPAGSPWYATDTGANPHYDGSNPLALPPNDCHAGSDPEPGKLCSLSELERVVPGRVQGAPPAVYAVSPSNDTNSGECDGGTWELTVIAKPGWNCIAASASDRAGGGTSTSANKGVSAPLRVCFDDGMSTPNCDPNIMPSCTQSCTINAAQLFGSDEVWPQQ